ncbi:CD225/dispanin family protein [Nocardiopsis chromatogenes]|uniref:hypothetical protein n=1 Tax=Nocardiopsis chromatogenes TaxID=280239 RepID=UPI00034C1F9A|nr:hypothetical protein [Nocardiopsis chromatogenes]
MSEPQLPPGAASPRDERAPSAERTADSPADGAPRAGGGSSSTMALILHALTFLCCGNWIFGIVGIVFAVRAAHARDRGQAEQAEILTRYSWYCLGAAAVMFTVMAVLTLWMFTQAGSWVQDAVPVPVGY